MRKTDASMLAQKEDLVLEVNDVRLDFNTYRGSVKALNGVNLGARGSFLIRL